MEKPQEKQYIRKHSGMVIKVTYTDKSAFAPQSSKYTEQHCAKVVHRKNSVQ